MKHLLKKGGDKEMEKTSPWWSTILALIAGLVVGFWLGSSGIPVGKEALKPSPKAVTTEIQFANHIQLNLPEQDVFIEETPGSNRVIRVEGETGQDPKNLAKRAFAANSAVEHDPFKVGASPLGPFPKGEDLGFSLGDWLSATGKGTYTVEGGTARLTLSFAKLVPGGVYTVWCSRITFPPDVEVVDKPCGASDGSENSFGADSKGDAAFSLSLEPLEESTAETVSVIALAYHSDGKTYGADPGEFGLNSHVQLVYIFPPPE